MKNMALEIAEITTILKEHQLLKHVVNNAKGDHQTITGVTYDSRHVETNDLFFCKGNFKPSYLETAQAKGASVYVAEQVYEQAQNMCGIVVTNVSKAMALIGAAYYDYPQNDLFIIAFTGTKGKTTSAYFTHHILNAVTKDQVALFSTIDRITGPKPEQEFKSDLTTPESLNLFHDMREAVDSGMHTLVMEVSSQAYLRNRVYGLHFDVGIFLNITPDHIGRNEHPTFENYLHCKLQLLVNSDICVINAQTAHFEEVYQAARATTDPDKIYLFKQANVPIETKVPMDIVFYNDQDNLRLTEIEIKSVSEKGAGLQIDGRYDLSMPGDYNQSNATSAILVAGLAGTTYAQMHDLLASVKVPGRMESITSKQHGVIYVDYAHNYASMNALLSFLRSQYPKGRMIVVVGSPGDKGISRRKGFGLALSAHADVAVLTADDPGFEDPKAIIEEIDQHIDHQKVQVKKVVDRYEAIKTAITMAKANDVVVLAAKGEDPYQKVKGVDTPWPTDTKVAKDVLKGLA
ncbi:udp-n-acetylmuramoylalanyl-d-glutamate--2,6-diaminopimelate ligase [Pediococcus cellicola]|uniref:UDP-N-acetylmuramyl-tripeptide synthetase n=2 Tax=Pediococcus cellicola TaxID=319652 RepID=A0A0R2IXT6_9LACO|nr:udp-n-acetylmuramoylalanyl-d-glutamate--2,6-diaminopimelate ligase [Pediococcus cellicola]